ncbi:MAG TPA: YidC/Oxa1 family membrane protein insertase [Thermomicrobiales bacterium]|nr:YidC/Oxa1 family membrane protein insertase [Thermomicrobiales bacterium]
MFDLILGPWRSFVDLIEWCLTNLADVTGSAGLAVIIFTIIAKTILLPLTIKSVRSTMAMQELQPKIKEIQKRYGKDRQKISEETLKLYAAHGVNPASGCLPMLAQMPIFFALFFAVRELSQGRSGHFAEGFLWIKDLGEPDRWDVGFFAIVPIAILAGIFQFIQMRMSRPANQGPVRDPQQAMMQGMMNFMPLMVVIFGWNFPAGVVLYWATQSLYSVIQQWFITGWGSLKDWFPWLPELPEERRLGRRKPQPATAGAAATGEPQQIGGFFGWMQKKTEELQKRQAERARAGAGEQRAAAPKQQQQDDTSSDDEDLPEGVVTIAVSGGQARRRGKRRRRGGTSSGD